MEQSTPINIHIDYLNVPETFSNSEWLVTNFQFNLTLQHSWRDIQNLLWKKSPENFLKPVFLKYQANGTRVTSESQKLEEFLGPGEDTLHLIVDLFLIGSRSIPVHRTPVDELFDIQLIYRGNSLRFRESLECGINSLKDYILEKEVTKKRREHLKFYLVEGRTYTAIDDAREDDEDTKLSQALKLDVAPLAEVTLLACLCPPYTPDTIHIRVESLSFPDTIKFAVDRFASVNEVKDEIAKRINNISFKLHYMSEDAIEDSNGPVFEVLHIPRDHVKLHVVLQNHDGQSVIEPTSTTLKAADFKPLQQTTFMSSDGEEWTSAGDTFETIISSKDGSKAMVRQAAFSTLEYVFSAVIDESGQEVSVTLNSSQCMVVDNGFHAPYVLLNPSAKAELAKVFQKSGQSLVQEVQLVQYEGNESPKTPTPTQTTNQVQQPVAPNPARGGGIQFLQDIMNRMPTPAQQVAVIPAAEAAPPQAAPEHEEVQQADEPAAPARIDAQGEPLVGRPIHITLLGMIMANLEDIFGRLVRYSFFIYMLGLHSLIFSNFALLVKVGAIAGVIYAFFFTNGRLSNWIERTFLTGIDVNRRLDTRLASRVVTILNVTNGLFEGFSGLINDFRNECMNIAIERERDFELILAIDEQETNLRRKLAGAWNNLWKDVLLFFITLFPSSYNILNSKLEKWRSDETKVLELALNQQLDLARIVLAQYGVENVEVTLNRELDSVDLRDLVQPNIDDLDLEQSKEVFYQILLIQLREMKRLVRMCRAGTKKFPPSDEGYNDNDNNEIQEE